jgi:SAM-dependent methyltransferase
MGAPRPGHEYVLGTHGAERDRLALQHSLWVDEARQGWRAAGIGRGSRVLDMGCGPGHAMEALLALVGPTGGVTGIELSPEFAAQARTRAASHARTDVQVHEFDLMSGPLPKPLNGAFDAVWCRWVAMFVRDPSKLVRAVHDALRPGGCVVFHEYVHYGTYGLHPHGGRVREFVEHAMASYAAEGGDADVGRRLPALLADAGMEVSSLRPIARVARPSDPLWNWPAGFVRTYSRRLLELGRVDEAWVRAVYDELDRAVARPESMLVAPTVLEVVAVRR